MSLLPLNDSISPHLVEMHQWSEPGHGKSPKTHYQSKSSFPWHVHYVNQCQAYSQCWEICSLVVFMRIVTITMGLPSSEIMMYLFCRLSGWASEWVWCHPWRHSVNPCNQCESGGGFTVLTPEFLSTLTLTTQCQMALRTNITNCSVACRCQQGPVTYQGRHISDHMLPCFLPIHCSDLSAPCAHNAFACAVPSPSFSISYSSFISLLNHQFFRVAFS